MAIEFGTEYGFSNCKSSTLIVLAIGANTRNVFFFLNNLLINLFKGNLGNF